jgi:trans-2,3-dihydro-3-hydroxyanthranilate isomerase
MKYQFYTCDVFTDARFGGNPLAVLPNAEGLTNHQMQQIAREFNFSESTFIFPAEKGHTKKVRIFTPAQEVPFAGHPNIGTAFVVANIGGLGEFNKSDIVFEEKAGLVPITVEKKNGKIICELKAPQNLSVGIKVPPEMVAQALSVTQEDIITVNHPPQVASVGLPFVIVELKSKEVLANVKVNVEGFEKIASLDIMPDIFVYTHSKDDFDIRARMFAPFDGIMEDPATGSASCALVALLSSLKKESEGTFSWNIAQGVEMGRPSFLKACTEKKNGEVAGVWISGNCMMVSEGYIEV